MVKAYRSWTKVKTSRYRQLEQKLYEIEKRDGETTSTKFASFVGFSSDSARLWLTRFEADGIIKLSRMRRGGERVYVLAV